VPASVWENALLTCLLSGERACVPASVWENALFRCLLSGEACVCASVWENALLTCLLHPRAEHQLAEHPQLWPHCAGMQAADAHDCEGTTICPGGVWGGRVQGAQLHAIDWRGLGIGANGRSGAAQDASSAR